MVAMTGKYVPPSRRALCDTCGVVVQVTRAKKGALTRCRPCRRSKPSPNTVRTRRNLPRVQHWVCVWCGKDASRPAARGQVPKYCGQPCATAAAFSRRIALRGEFSISASRRRRLHERDGWVCQICGEATSASWTRGDIWSPTLDHIVPRSVVVDDSDENLRTAHHFCNTARSADRRTDAEVRLLAEARRRV